MPGMGLRMAALPSLTLGCARVQGFRLDPSPASPLLTGRSARPESPSHPPPRQSCCPQATASPQGWNRRRSPSRRRRLAYPIHTVAGTALSAATGAVTMPASSSRASSSVATLNAAVAAPASKVTEGGAVPEITSPLPVTVTVSASVATPVRLSMNATDASSVAGGVTAAMLTTDRTTWNTVTVTLAASMLFAPSSAPVTA